ncbi:MAG: DUF1934 domain-containing protein [bacterium]|nr:DUF1934 domain-containing protein [bacterium]MCM1373791.1 DUF1934 domain-containing protein [Muribaculum sp.]
MDKAKAQITIRSVFAPVMPDGRTIAWEDPQCQRMVTQAGGEFYQKGDTCYCIYMEQQEGWEKPCRSMLKWREQIVLKRSMGGMDSPLTYEAGKRCRCHYRTPYGELLLETDTHRLEIQEKAEGYLLVIECGIRQNGQSVSENRIEIQIDII